MKKVIKIKDWDYQCPGCGSEATEVFSDECCDIRPRKASRFWFEEKVICRNCGQSITFFYDMNLKGLRYEDFDFPPQTDGPNLEGQFLSNRIASIRKVFCVTTEAEDES